MTAITFALLAIWAEKRSTELYSLGLPRGANAAAIIAFLFAIAATIGACAQLIH